MATTVANQTTPRKAPRAWYGWLDEQHGIWLLVDNSLNFLDDATGQWQEVDLPTFRLWGQLNGEVALAEAARIADGNRVLQCSKTLQAA